MNLGTYKLKTLTRNEMKLMITIPTLLSKTPINNDSDEEQYKKLTNARDCRHLGH